MNKFKPLTADTALDELSTILVNVHSNKSKVKAILVKLAQDAYRRGYNTASKVERSSDHE